MALGRRLGQRPEPQGRVEEVDRHGSVPPLRPLVEAGRVGARDLPVRRLAVHGVVPLAVVERSVDRHDPAAPGHAPGADPGLLHPPAVRGAVLVPVAGERLRHLPERVRHVLRRRPGPASCRGGHAGGPPGLRGLQGLQADGRLPAARHPVRGSAGHRQDPDGQGDRGRLRRAVPVRHGVGLREHVHGHREPEGAQAVQEGPRDVGQVRRVRDLHRRDRRGGFSGRR